MIHAIYTRNKPKSKWFLASIATNAEEVREDLEALKKYKNRSDNISLEIAVKTFDSALYIPEMVSEIKEQNLVLN